MITRSYPSTRYITLQITQIGRGYRATVLETLPNGDTELLASCEASKTAALDWLRGQRDNLAASRRGRLIFTVALPWDKRARSWKRYTEWPEL